MSHDGFFFFLHSRIQKCRSKRSLLQQFLTDLLYFTRLRTKMYSGMCRKVVSLGLKAGLCRTSILSLTEPCRTACVRRIWCVFFISQFLLLIFYAVFETSAKRNFMTAVCENKSILATCCRSRALKCVIFLQYYPQLALYMNAGRTAFVILFIY